VNTCPERAELVNLAGGAACAAPPTVPARCACAAEENVNASTEIKPNASGFPMACRLYS
jgi:hypothetical protein